MTKGGRGDILIFLPGELAIKNCVQALAELDTDEAAASSSPCTRGSPTRTRDGSSSISPASAR